MGCFSDREKGAPSEDAKWTYITLSDFRCTSFWSVAAYFWLWVLVCIGVAVYVVDTYTAVNLLAFDHWSSKVQPKLDFKYSKWIFAICILLSWALCIYEWIRAIRVIRRGGVAESFLDPLAVNVQSMRRQGWKRFLVFTELTKSKKGADYVALFVYFSFKSAIRVIFAEGPRQVVNALTLYAVMEAQLLPGSTHDDSGAERNNFDQFWFNVQALADEDKQQAVVYFGMLFTLCIWVFSALSLIISFIMYIFFLWHYIPQRDGRLSIYCKRKVDKRLAKIVEHKVKLGIEKEQRQAEKLERKAELHRQKTGDLVPPAQAALKKQPTLPDIGSYTAESKQKEEMQGFPLARQDTTATLPLYSARPRTSDEQQEPTLPRVMPNRHPGMPMRSGTQSSARSAAPSYSTEAPLLANAGYAGGPQDDVPLPTPGGMPQTSYSYFPPVHSHTDSQDTQDPQRAFTPGPGPRSQTPMSARSFTPGLGPRMQTPTTARSFTPGGYPRGPPPPRFPPPARSNTAFSVDQVDPHATTGPPLQGPFQPPFHPPPRSNTADGFRPQPHATRDSESSFPSLRSQQSFSRPMPARNGSQPGPFRAYTPVASTVPETARASSPESYEMQPQPSRSTTPAQQPKEGYVAFNPSMQTQTTQPTSQDGVQRSMTVSRASAGHNDEHVNGLQLSVPQRSATASAQLDMRHSNYAHDILAEYGPSEEERVRTPSPLPVTERRATPDAH